MKNIILFLLILFSFKSRGQDSPTIQIDAGYDGIPEVFCYEPIKIAPVAVIAGTTVPDQFKISIVNYKSGEDTIYYSGTNTSIISVWNSNGSIELYGGISREDYQNAIREVYYNNVSNDPTSEIKKFTISFADADYLPKTGHFYQYVKQAGIRWTEARAAAEAKTLYGLKGYLATITSAEENAFIWSKTQGVGWIGASDIDKSDEWKWETGPEAGTIFWRGKGTGSPVNNAYSNWNTGEPNDSGGEYYAHITYGIGIAGSWNDLRDQGSTDVNSNYHPQGYLIEYGGLESTTIKLSDVTEIEVINFKFSETLDTTICQFETVALNHDFIGDYSWSPSQSLNNASLPNPLASPLSTTKYTVNVTLGTCVLTEEFTVYVNPAPITEIHGIEDICIGDVETLSAIILNPQGSETYSWSNGESGSSINIEDEKWYSVFVDNGQCTYRDSIYITVHEYPEFSLDKSDTLICGTGAGPYSGTLEIEQTKGEVTWIAEDTGMTIDKANANQTSMRVGAYGPYRIFVDVVDQYGCQVLDTLDVGFYQMPTSDFSIDESECYGYNVKVNYLGNAEPGASYYWIFQEDTTVGVDLGNTAISLGVDDRENRTLSLIVNDKGCVSSKTSTHVQVIPNLQVWADTTAFCQPFTANFHQQTTEVIDKYIWHFGTGDSIVDVKNPSYTYNDAGTYDVQLKIISDEGCENIAELKDFIIVHPIPTAELDVDPDFCYGDTIEINYIGTANSAADFLWELSDLDANEIISNPGHSNDSLLVSLQNKPNASIGFQVISEYNCVSEYIIATFKRKPIVELVPSVWEGCPILDVDFQVNTLDEVDQLYYNWNLIGGNWNVGTVKESYSYAQPDSSYSINVELYSTITTCIDTISLEKPIYVYPKPKADFSVDTLVRSIVDPLFHFENLSIGAQLYYWDFGDSLGISSEEHPDYEYEDMGYFDVKLISENEWACVDSAFQEILVRFEKIFPPTAFSPNADLEENQTFKMYTKGVLEEGYHLQIYNRWGQPVFECENEHLAWDGTMKNGNPAPAGSYVWVVSYTDFLGVKHKQNGLVTLMY